MNRAFMEELEPRVLLSGTPAPETGPSPAIDAGSQDETHLKNDQVISEVAFIDQRVEDYEKFVENIDANIEIIFIGQDQNGLDIISSYLEEKNDISAIHLISHGSTGSINLGNTQLSSQSINSYENKLKGWASSLSMDADILIYGCNVAQNLQFVDKIANLTGADIAASNDLSGNIKLGGDADLEVHNGNIESLSLPIHKLSSVLAGPDAINDSYTYLGQLDVNETEGLLNNDSFSIDPLHPTNYEFSEEQASDATWTASDLTWTMKSFGVNTNINANPETQYSGITSSYVFDGNSNTGATTATFETLAGNPTNSSASFEIWFKPDNLTQNAILFETGATTDGISIYLNSSSELVVHVRDNVSLTSEVKTTLTDTNEFTQVVAVLDYTSNELKLYVNGTLSATTTLVGTDWAGGSGSGLGTDSNGPAAGTGDFKGEIARFNFYSEALEASEVQGNFDSISTAKPQVTAVNGNPALVGNPIITANNSSITINADGSFNYQPQSTFDGDETVTYTITDGNGNSDTASVTFTSGIADDTYTALGNLEKNANEGLFANDDAAGSLNIKSTDYSFGDTQATGETWTSSDLTWTMRNFGTNTTFTSSPVSNYGGITSAYVFDGTSNTGAHAPTFETLGNPTNDSATLELWVKPDNLTQDAVIFETGGGTDGTSIYLKSNGDLVFHVRDDRNVISEVTHSLAAITDFIQIAAVIDYDAASNGLQLYVDGTLVGSTDLLGSDWSGTSGAALATDSNGNAQGSGEFSGQIAMFNFYKEALSATEVLDNFNAISETPTQITAINGNGALVGNEFTTAKGGTLTVNANGSFEYTPIQDFSGEDSFTYTVTDHSGNTATATVTINAAATDDAYSINEDDNLNTPAPGVLANDVDVNSAGLFVKSFDSSGTQGTVTMTTMDLQMGEAGSAQVNSIGTTVNLQKDYETPPLVFAFITTTNETDASVVLVENVTVNSFDLRLDESVVRDGVHGNETVSYLVLEEGEWMLPDGTLIEVGTHQTKSNSSTFDTINFNSAFTTTPAVFTQVQGNVNNIDLLKTRQSNSSTASFEVTLEPADNYTVSNITELETIAYFAIEKASGNWGQIEFESGDTGNSVTANTYSFDINSNFTPENFIAGMASFNGGDNASTRGQGISNGEISLFIEEDITVDPETNHISETVNYLAFAGSGILYATPQSGLASSGDFTYDPGSIFNSLAAGQTATDSFTYTLSDLYGNESKATVEITINGTNDAPESADKAITIAEDFIYKFKASDFPFNDIDNGDSIKSVRIDSVPPAGSGILLFNGLAVTPGSIIAINQIGLLSFQGELNEHGAPYTSFNFSVQDQQNAFSTSKTLTINVTSVNDKAIFTGDLQAKGIQNGPPLTGSISVSDINDGITTDNFSIFKQSPNGIASIDNTGNWQFVVKGNFSGPTSFTVSVLDDAGFIELQTINIFIEPLNIPNINAASLEGFINNDGTPSPSNSFINSANTGQDILRGNAFLFLSNGSGLHFNEEFLSNDSLNLISEYFNASTSIDNEVASPDGNADGVKTMNIYDLSPLEQTEQIFIYDLIKNELKESLEDEEEDLDLSFKSDERALEELIVSKGETTDFHQIHLDQAISLEDTLLGQFDCFATTSNT